VWLHETECSAALAGNVVLAMWITAATPFHHMLAILLTDKATYHVAMQSTQALGSCLACSTFSYCRFYHNEIYVLFMFFQEFFKCVMKFPFWG
jgi:hypothetical protein